MPPPRWSPPFGTSIGGVNEAGRVLQLKSLAFLFLLGAALFFPLYKSPYIRDRAHLQFCHLLSPYTPPSDIGTLPSSNFVFPVHRVTSIFVYFQFFITYISKWIFSPLSSYLVPPSGKGPHRNFQHTSSCTLLRSLRTSRYLKKIFFFFLCFFFAFLAFSIFLFVLAFLFFKTLPWERFHIYISILR